MAEANRITSQFAKNILTKEFFFSTLAITLSVATIVLISTYVTTIFLATYPASMLSYYYIVQSMILMIITYASRNIIALKPKLFAITVQIINVVLIITHLFLGGDFWKYATLIYCALLTTTGGINAVIAWNFVSWTYTIRTFKNISRWFSATGTLFGIILGFMLPIVIYGFGVHILVYLILMSVILFCIPISTMNITIHPSNENKLIKHAGDIKQFKIFFWVVIYVAIVLMSNTLIDYVAKSTIAETKNSADIASYMATLIASANTLVLIAQTLLVKPCLRWFGAGGILYILPIAIITVSIGYLIYPSLITVSIVFVINLGIYYSLHTLAREIALNVLPPLVRAKAKSLVKGFANTIGTIVGAIIIVAVMKLFDVYINVIIITVASFILLLLASKIKFYYKESLKDQLLLKSFKSEELATQLESQEFYTQVLKYTIKSKDTGLNLLGISILKKKPPNHLPKEIINWLESHTDELFLASAELCQFVKDEQIIQPVIRRLWQERDEVIQYELLQTLYFQAPEEAKKFAEHAINDPRATLSALSAYILLQKGNIEAVLQSVKTINRLINSKKAAERAEVAKILGNIKIGNLTEELSALLNDESDAVCVNALYSVADNDEEKLIPVVAKQLHRSTIVYHIIKLADKFGDPLLKPILYQLTKNGSLKNSVNFAKIINQINTPNSEIFTIELMQQSDFFEAYQLAKYFAYHCKSNPIAQENIPKVLALIYRHVDYIVTLYTYNLTTRKGFVKNELDNRIYWAKKSFLYLLASIVNTTQVLPIIPTLSQAINQNNQSNINAALELIETHLSSAEQKKLLNKIFDDLDKSKVDTKLSNVIAHDAWLTKITQYASQQSKGEIMESLEKIIILRQCELFKSLPGEALLAIAEETNIIDYAKGDIIYEQGDMPDALYIIAAGEIDLTREDEILLQLWQYDFFGFMGIIQNEPYYAKAQAMTPCQLLVIDKATFDRILDDIPDVLMSITQILANYLARILKNKRLKLPS